MKNKIKSIILVILNTIQFNVFYQSLFVMDSGDFSVILTILLVMLYALVYREIIRNVLKINMKEFYIHYFIGFILYGGIFMIGGDIWHFIELIMTLGLIVFTNVVTGFITYKTEKRIK